MRLLALAYHAGKHLFNRGQGRGEAQGGIDRCQRLAELLKRLRRVIRQEEQGGLRLRPPNMMGFGQALGRVVRNGLIRMDPGGPDSHRRTGF